MGIFVKMTEWWARTCPMQLLLPRVLQVWLKSSSSQRGREEPVLPMQSRLSRLRLLENSLRDGRQLKMEKNNKGYGFSTRNKASWQEEERQWKKRMWTYLGTAFGEKKK